MVQSRYVQLNPKNGRLVLFESWVKHEVPPNLSSQERIRISFNYDWVYICPWLYRYYRYDLRVAQLEKGLMKNLDHPHRTFKFQTGYKISSSLMLDGVILISTDTGKLPSKALDSVSNDSSLSFLKRPRSSHTL
jgi:hypothetical protein